MNETSVTPIGSIQQVETGSPLNAPTQLQTGTAPHEGEFSIQRKAQTAPASGSANPEKSQKPPRNEAIPVESTLNISLQFRVDDKTRELTVFVIDRQSKRVLRSIPASELRKLNAGDLFKLTA